MSDNAFHAAFLAATAELDAASTERPATCDLSPVPPSTGVSAPIVPSEPFLTLSGLLQLIARRRPS